MLCLAAVGSVMERRVGWVCAAQQKACSDVADAAGGFHWVPSPSLTHTVLSAVARLRAWSGAEAGEWVSRLLTCSHPHGCSQVTFGWAASCHSSSSEGGLPFSSQAEGWM